MVNGRVPRAPSSGGDHQRSRCSMQRPQASLQSNLRLQSLKTLPNKVGMAKQHSSGDRGWESDAEYPGGNVFLQFP